MSENNKVIAFVGIMCVVVAVILAGLRGATLEMAKSNEAVFNQRAILKAMDKELPTPVAELSDNQVREIFQTKMGNSKVINYAGEVIEDEQALNIKLEEEKKKPEDERRLPLFIYEDGTNKYYILSMRGSGLWDEIWGNMAVKSDLKTVVGVSFDHKGETPGLGAEIKDNQTWVNQFQNKLIYNEENKGYEGILVRKGGAKNPKYEVDGLSGATVTANGVTAMIENAITWYKPYLSELYAKAGK